MAMTDTTGGRHDGWRLGAAAAILAAALGAAAAPETAEERADQAGNIEFRAKSRIDQGVELVETGQTERGLKLLASVPREFPKAKARFRAWLYLGRHYLDKGDYPLAIRSLRPVCEADNDDQKAEAMYRLGICHYKMDDFNKAFMRFRKVTNEFPWSVFANQAYYYIGQCHYRLNRWSKAIEALELVGTSVPPNLKTASRAEAGQRLFVKVHDKDLVILTTKGQPVRAVFRAASGDEETVLMERLGRSGEYYLGSVRTEPNRPDPGDGVLQFAGSEKVTLTYVDRNTKTGKTRQELLATVRLVSTASAGFTDGAYREYTEGVYGDRECFMRVKDLDRDATADPDRIRVKLLTQYTVTRQAAEGGEDTFLDTPRKATRTRDAVEVDLVEQADRSGVFVGKIVPRMIAAPDEADPADDVLSALQGDQIVLQYVDELHAKGSAARTVAAKAKILVGSIQDVRIEHRVVESVRDKARKDLIEGQIYLKLGQIFKDVGLEEKASQKAAEGLGRVDDVIAVHLNEKATLDREIVEEAFSVKWDLLLVQDRLDEAIEVCRTLMTLFPDSSLADQALFKIAVARMKSARANEDDREMAAAMQIFTEVTRLENSALAAEAQFMIARILEEQAEKQAAKHGGDLAKTFSKALLAYQRCARRWPDSPFAGQALERVARYYITTKDYPRAIELMERVLQDYEDNAFLPRMMLMWVWAAYQMGDAPQARVKARQLITQYPGHQAAKKAKELLEGALAG
jgi:TolA-binding protein